MKQILTFLVMLLGSSAIMAQTTIFNVSGVSIPSGWTATNNVTANTIQQTGTGGYFLLEAGSLADVITTSTYDLTGATSASFTVNVATYGSGTPNRPASIQFSSDGGATWTAAQTTATPSSSDYISSGTITPPAGFIYNNQFMMRITNAGTTGRGVRLQNLVLNATIPTSPCVAPAAPTGNTLTATSYEAASGSFTGVTPAPTGYLVLYSTSATAPTVVDGSTYSSGSTPAGTNFVQSGTTTSYSLTGLNPTTTYYTYVYAYNNTNCTGGPVYSAVASASVTTPAIPPSGVQLGAANTLYTIDFDNTVDYSNTGAFAGTTWNTTGAAGSLNSNTWYQNPNDATATPVFGGSYTNGEGAITPGSNPTSGGFYALATNTGNSLAIQPTGSAFNPGQIVLKVQNTTGGVMNSLSMGYTALVNNNAPRSTSIQVSYSTDGVNFTPLGPVLNTPLNATPTPLPSLMKHYMAGEMTGLNVPADGFVYIRWAYADNGGSGARDELGIDDIDLVANATTTTPIMRADTYTTVGIATDVTAQGNSTIVAGIGFIDGILNTSSLNLPTVLQSAQIVGGSATSYVDGPINIQRNTTTSVVVPVGDNGVFSPVALQPTSTTSTTYQVEYFNQPPANSTSVTAPLEEVSQVEYWNVAQIDGTSPANITLGWNANSQVSDVSPIEGAHWNGSSWVMVPATVSGTATAGTIAMANVTGFGLFTLGSTEPNVLPVTLLSFEGKLTTANTASLAWVTTCELNMSRYELQRSENGISFSSIATLAAVNGGCGVNKTYSHLDGQLAAGKTYSYRLRMIETDGKITYSNTIVVKTGTASSLPYIAGNPVRNDLQLANLSIGDVIRIATIDGRVVINYRATAATSVKDVSTLAPGTYYISILGNANTTLKMIKR